MKTFIKRLIPVSWLLFYHKLRAIAANLIYGFPSRGLTIIGVTGTNGKTTTCQMIYSILQSVGCKTALATTVDFRIGDQITPNITKMTTINPWKLQAFLAQARDERCQYAVIEITSHSLVQNRVWGIRIDGAVLTNITYDHLDYHKTMTAYKQAKLKLFQNEPYAIAVNYDNENFQQFINQPAKIKLSYSLEPASKADVRATDIRQTSAGTRLIITAREEREKLNLPLPGRFNVSNALAAIAITLSYGITVKAAIRALEQMSGVRGRMEQIDLGQDFTVLVDYAHTPDALEKVYEAIKPWAKSRIIAVFGATGNRDKAKRPILGRIASRNADICIVTDEDPDNENPIKIIEQVAKGVVEGAPSGRKRIEGKNFFKIVNRREAIKLALRLAKSGDIVLITGKGHEEVMVVNSRHIPFNEKEIVEKELIRVLENGSHR